MKTKEKQKKAEQPKIGFQLKTYFSKHKVAILMFILLNVLGSVCSIVITVLVANMVSKIAESQIEAAILLCVWAIILIIAMRAFGYLAGLYYYKYSRKIMRDKYLILKMLFKKEMLQL